MRTVNTAIIIHSFSRLDFHKAKRYPRSIAEKTSHRSTTTMDGHESEDPKQSTADMTDFVQNLLQQMQSRFQTMSDSIVTKIDEMGSRINELEQSINDLRAEMGVEGSPSPLTSSKPSPAEAKQEEGSA